MLYALTLVAADAAVLAEAGRRAGRAVAAAGGRVKEPRPLGPDAQDWFIEADAELAELRPGVREALAGLAVDHAFQPAAGRRKRLLVADMDSTIIDCECLDELADFAGVKAEVAAVTERAMRGELAFEPALRERVARLKGLPVQALERCLAERVRLNPGARTLTATMRAAGGRCVLVSGGFESFTGPVAAMAGFDAHHGNGLLHDGSALTGEVRSPVLGREAKLDTLQREAGDLGVELAETLAVGDGANDLAMIEAAGLGVAYRAKPVVSAAADAAVDHGDLTALLYFQGFAREAWADA